MGVSELTTRARKGANGDARRRGRLEERRHGEPKPRKEGGGAMAWARKGADGDAMGV